MSARKEGATQEENKVPFGPHNCLKGFSVSPKGRKPKGLWGPLSVTPEGPKGLWGPLCGNILTPFGPLWAYIAFGKADNAQRVTDCGDFLQHLKPFGRNICPPSGPLWGKILLSAKPTT